MSLCLVRGGQQPGAVSRSGLLAVLRTVRDGGKIDGMHVPTLEAVTEAIGKGWLEPLNDRARVENWKYKLTPQGRREADGPVLRLVVGGKA